jgi:hypothetical protein
MGHHYISRCYLAGFTSDDTRDGKLHAFDLSNGRIWQSTTIEVAHENGFNTVDGPDRDALEKQLSEFEHEIAPILRSIRGKRLLPEGTDRWKMMQFMSMLAIRNPANRKKQTTFETDILRTTLQFYLFSPERWSALLEELSCDNIAPLAKLTFDEAKELLQPEKWRMKKSPAYFHEVEFHQVDIVTRFLMARNWVLMQAPFGIEVITHDNPVIPLPDGVSGNMPYGLGYGSAIAFPISSELILFGRFDQPEASLEVSDKSIAAINVMVFQRASRFAYARSNTFDFLTDADTIDRYPVSTPGERSHYSI